MRPAINPDRLLATVRGLEDFTNDALGLQRGPRTLTGLEYVADLLDAAYANTYVETVGQHADSLHLAIKRTSPDRIIDAYLNRATRVGRRHELANKDIVLAFDHTDEDYYGQLDSTYLHAWTGEKAVTGKWKFLTAAIINRDHPPRVPILSIPTPIGYETEKQVAFMINRIRPLVANIRLAIFDRGFYKRELMRTLDQDLKLPYLIFAPSTAITRREFSTMKKGDKKTIHHEFRVNKNKTQVPGDTTLALLKHIYSPRAEKHFDWTFATNQTDIDLDTIIQRYTARWRIETGFRIQDEARIKSKTKQPAIRFFHFAFEQALQFSWASIYQDDAPYKAFLKQLLAASRERVHHVHDKRERRHGTGS